MTESLTALGLVTRELTRRAVLPDNNALRNAVDRLSEQQLRCVVAEVLEIAAAIEAECAGGVRTLPVAGLAVAHPGECSMVTCSRGQCPHVVQCIDAGKCTSGDLPAFLPLRKGFAVGDSGDETHAKTCRRCSRTYVSRCVDSELCQDCRTPIERSAAGESASV